MSHPLVTGVWLNLLNRVINDGVVSQPRGLCIHELLCNTTIWPMEYPILLHAERKLNYPFMADEALWILNGDARVDTLSHHCKAIRRYSDDGIHMSGAYGPKIVAQLRYIIDTLIADSDSRQAVLTIWERNPRESKDIPCTLSMQFLIRSGRLHCIATMRSSDVWLGIPYDVFSFSMVATYICLRLRDMAYKNIGLGKLQITAGSQHIYETNVPAALECLKTIGEREKIKYDYTHVISPAHLLRTLSDLSNAPVL